MKSAHFLQLIKSILNARILPRRIIIKQFLDHPVVINTILVLPVGSSMVYAPENKFITA